MAQCFFDSAAQSVIPAVVGRDKDVLAHVNARFWARTRSGGLARTVERLLPQVAV